MISCEATEVWSQFLEFAKNRCSATAFGNWLAPIRVLSATEEEIVLEIPNIFVKEYLLSNYKQDLCAFLPLSSNGEPSIKFVIASPVKKPSPEKKEINSSHKELNETFTDENRSDNHFQCKFNANYSFENYIEGGANQFVKSAALGVASRPGQSYNPLFIHGNVGLGKTHMLHSIGHYVQRHHRKLKVHCITTEAFINDLVDGLRNKSVDRMKKFYRSDVDILLVDDIQFLQNRLNFEEEFCHTFENLIHQNKQIVITSDKPPAQLKLSERMIARMEWGLVAHVGMPELETRVAILQNKAEQRGLQMPNSVAFFIAERICLNVRQLEGAINRLSAHCRLWNEPITKELVEKLLPEMFQQVPLQKLSVEQILKVVGAVFEVSVKDLKGSTRTKDLALARQVAMYLAKELVHETLTMIAASFGKSTHSIILHAHRVISELLQQDEKLKRRVEMVRRNLHNA